MSAMTPEDLKHIITLHAKWLDGDADGVWANLDGADLRETNLDGANLDGANLRGANFDDRTVLCDGVTWAEYLRDVVPALLVAGGRTLRDIATPKTWDCHSWENCPMAEAFGVHTIADVPTLHRWQAQRFVQFFDAGLISLDAIVSEAK